jgi:hypothetical protein
VIVLCTREFESHRLRFCFEVEYGLGMDWGWVKEIMLRERMGGWLKWMKSLCELSFGGNIKR